MPRYKSVHTGPQIDSGVSRALPGGEIDRSLESKAEIEFLDNTDFTNPVAQAGVGGNHGSVAYALDRWILVSGTVSASSNGLTLNGVIRQIREKSIGSAVVPSIEMYSGTATITYDDTTKYCDIVSSGGVIKRPHLGLSTISNWSKMPCMDSDVNLLKCQKHYLKIANFYAYGFAASDSLAYVAFTPPAPMRTTPSVLADNIGILYSNGGYIVPSSASVVANNYGQIVLAVNATGLTQYSDIVLGNGIGYSFLADLS